MSQSADGAPEKDNGVLIAADCAAARGRPAVHQRMRKGVAIIAQDDRAADQLLSNDRSLPIAHFRRVDAESDESVGAAIDQLLTDPRVTAFGVCLREIGNAAQLAATHRARQAGRAVAVYMPSHDEVFDAYCRQTGIARCESLPCLCETLKLFHTGGPLRGGRILMAGASGGAMAITADAARDSQLTFPPIPPDRALQLRELPTDKVAVDNPLDFHSHIWFDAEAMPAMFACLHGSGFDATVFVIDCPPLERADAAAYLTAIDQFIDTYTAQAGRAFVLSSLPESLGAPIRDKCLAAGIAPLQGQREGLAGEASERCGPGASEELGIAVSLSNVPGVADMFVKVRLDRQFGQVLELGPSGPLSALLDERAVLLPPFCREDIRVALERLRLAAVLTGLRGSPAADSDAFIDAVLICAQFAAARVDTLIELQVDPLVVGPAGHGVAAMDVRICERKLSAAFVS